MERFTISSVNYRPFHRVTGEKEMDPKNNIKEGRRGNKSLLTQKKRHDRSFSSFTLQ